MENYSTYQTPLSRYHYFEVCTPWFVDPPLAAMQAKRWPTCFRQRSVACFWFIWQFYHRSQNRFYTWRKLWLNLAKAEKQLGLPISEEAIKQMEANLVRILCCVSTCANVAHSILTPVSLRLLRWKKRSEDTMSWLMFTPSGRLLPLRQALSSACLCASAHPLNSILAFLALEVFVKSPGCVYHRAP